LIMMLSIGFYMLLPMVEVFLQLNYHKIK